MSNTKTNFLGQIKTQINNLNITKINITESFLYDINSYIDYLFSINKNNELFNQISLDLITKLFNILNEIYKKILLLIKSINYKTKKSNINSNSYKNSKIIDLYISILKKFRRLLIKKEINKKSEEIFNYLTQINDFLFEISIEYNNPLFTKNLPKILSNLEEKINNINNINNNFNLYEYINNYERIIEYLRRHYEKKGKIIPIDSINMIIDSLRKIKSIINFYKKNGSNIFIGIIDEIISDLHNKSNLYNNYFSNENLDIILYKLEKKIKESIQSGNINKLFQNYIDIYKRIIELVKKIFKNNYSNEVSISVFEKIVFSIRRVWDLIDKKNKNYILFRNKIKGVISNILSKASRIEEKDSFVIINENGSARV